MPPKVIQSARGDRAKAVGGEANLCGPAGVAAPGRDSDGVSSDQRQHARGVRPPALAAATLVVIVAFALGGLRLLTAGSVFDAPHVIRRQVGHEARRVAAPGRGDVEELERGAESQEEPEAPPRRPWSDTQSCAGIRLR